MLNVRNWAPAEESPRRGEGVPAKGKKSANESSIRLPAEHLPGDAPFPAPLLIGRFHLPSLKLSPGSRLPGFFLAPLSDVLGIRDNKLTSFARALKHERCDRTRSSSTTSPAT